MANETHMIYTNTQGNDYISAILTQPNKKTIVCTIKGTGIKEATRSFHTFTELIELLTKSLC